MPLQEPLERWVLSEQVRLAAAELQAELAFWAGKTTCGPFVEHLSAVFGGCLAAVASEPGARQGEAGGVHAVDGGEALQPCVGGAARAGQGQAGQRG
jgi:hypothetical protein